MIWTNNPIGIKDIQTNSSGSFNSLEDFWLTIILTIDNYFPKGFVDFLVFLEDRTDFNKALCDEYFNRIIEQSAVYSEGFIFFAERYKDERLMELSRFGRVLFKAIGEDFDPVPLERAFAIYRELN